MKHLREQRQTLRPLRLSEEAEVETEESCDAKEDQKNPELFFQYSSKNFLEEIQNV